MRRRSMKELQANLWLEFDGSLSYNSPFAKIQEVTQLLDGLASICEDHANLETAEVQTSSKLRKDSNELLHRLGPHLWPDVRDIIKAGGEWPVWLSKGSCDRPSWNPIHYFNSHSWLRELLSIRFHHFVCARVSNNIRNTRNRNRNRSKSNMGSHVPSNTGSHSRSTPNRDLELDGLIGCDDEDFFDFDLFEGDGGLDNSVQVSADLLNDRAATPSAAGRVTSPNSTPATPTVADDASTGNNQASVNEADAEQPRPEPAQCMNYREGSGNDRRDQSSSDVSANSISPLNAVKAGFSVARTSDQVAQPNDQQRNHAKRTSNTLRLGAKRCRFTPNGYNLKPSLIVKRPQIQRKDVSTTGSAQRISTSFPGNDEVVAGPSTRPMHSQWDSLGNRARCELEPCQSDLQSHNLDFSLKAPNAGDAHGTVVSPPAQSSQASVIMPRDKGKGRAVDTTSCEPRVYFTEQEIETIAQFREKWSIGEDQIIDELLLVALTVASAEDLVVQILDQDYPQISVSQSPEMVQEGDLSSANQKTKRAVVVDLTASSEEEDNTADTSSDAVRNARAAKSRRLFVASNGGYCQDLAVAEATSPNAEASSQHAKTGNSSHCEATKNSHDADRKHLDNILGHVRMMLRVKRGHGTTLPVAHITLEQVHTSEDIFRAAENEFPGILKTGEAFTRAHVMQVHGASMPNMEGGFTLGRGSRKNISWDIWLKDLRAVFILEPRAFAMSMQADILVTRTTGSSV